MTKGELILAVLKLSYDDRLDLILAVVASLRPGVIPPVVAKDEPNGFPVIGSEASGQPIISWNVWRCYGVVVVLVATVTGGVVLSNAS